MSLLSTLETYIHLGYTIEIKPEWGHYVLKLSKEGKSKESWMPLSDHFSEGHIIRHLDLMSEDIQQQPIKRDK